MQAKIHTESLEKWKSPIAVQPIGVQIAIGDSLGRGDRIRTCGFYVPNVALYQAEPHLEGAVRQGDGRKRTGLEASAPDPGHGSGTRI